MLRENAKGKNETHILLYFLLILSSEKLQLIILQIFFSVKNSEKVNKILNYLLFFRKIIPALQFRKERFKALEDATERATSFYCSPFFYSLIFNFHCTYILLIKIKRENVYYLINIGRIHFLQNAKIGMKPL